MIHQLWEFDAVRALSLTQPWATAIRYGIKRVETRSWSTSYRGPIAIHAALKMPPEAVAFCISEMSTTRLPRPETLPRGVIVAVATLVGCKRTESVVGELAADERRYGNYSPGRWAWMLSDVDPLPQPVPCRGYQGLWTVPAPIVDRIIASFEGAIA